MLFLQKKSHLLQIFDRLMQSYEGSSFHSHLLKHFLLTLPKLKFSFFLKNEAFLTVFTFNQNYKKNLFYSDKSLS